MPTATRPSGLLSSVASVVHRLPSLDHVGQDGIAHDHSPGTSAVVPAAIVQALTPQLIELTPERVDAVFAYFEEDALAELKATGKEAVALHDTPLQRRECVQAFLSAVGLIHVDQQVPVTDPVVAAGIKPIHDYVQWEFGQNEVTRTICDGGTQKLRVCNGIRAAGGVPRLV